MELTCVCVCVCTGIEDMGGVDFLLGCVLITRINLIGFQFRRLVRDNNFWMYPSKKS
jgi:hypothetical protein